MRCEAGGCAGPAPIALGTVSGRGNGLCLQGVREEGWRLGHRGAVEPRFCVASDTVVILKSAQLFQEKLGLEAGFLLLLRSRTGGVAGSLPADPLEGSRVPLRWVGAEVAACKAGGC